MLNIYDFIEDHPNKFRQFKVNEQLFVEYHCMIEDSKMSTQIHDNYFTYTLKGKKGINYLGEEYIVDEGDCLFIKKGANIVHQFFEEDYCALLIFLPEEFIKRAIQKHQINCQEINTYQNNRPIIRVHVDEVLFTYFHSLLSYFFPLKSPPKALLKVKFEELIIDIVTGKNNPSLAGYFKELCGRDKIPISQVIEANFAYNLKMEEFARLCGRSLSTFRRDFEKTYGTAPGKWLTQRRLEYGKYLLETTGKSIRTITLEIGFKNPSHFVRIFKQKYGTTPLQFKEQ